MILIGKTSIVQQMERKQLKLKCRGGGGRGVTTSVGQSRLEFVPEAPCFSKPLKLCTSATSIKLRVFSITAVRTVVGIRKENESGRGSTAVLFSL